MNWTHFVDIALALACGYFWGLGRGYQTANREYKATIDGACETLAKGSKCIEKLRERLRSRTILNMRTELNALRAAESIRRTPIRNDQLKEAIAGLSGSAELKCPEIGPDDYCDDCRLYHKGGCAPSARVKL